MIVLALAAGLVAFVAVLRLSGAEAMAREAVDAAGRGARIVAAPGLDEREKERLVRRSSLQLFRSAGLLAAAGLAALAAAVGIVWLGSAAGFYDADEAVEVAMGWPFLIGSTVGAVALWAALSRLRARRQGA